VLVDQDENLHDAGTWRVLRFRSPPTVFDPAR
jgi:hypothetical protein